MELEFSMPSQNRRIPDDAFPPNILYILYQVEESFVS